jgi:serine/threonine-protein kinase
MTTSPSFPPGYLVAGRYELVELLGQGGHGTVYRALQRPLGREVALKMIAADAIGAEGTLERFAREAALVQRLEHPNTVRIFDFGTTEVGLPYIVFELVRGKTLEQELKQGPMTAFRVGRVASQVLKSLMEAHALGIVHRDVKPSNVMLVDYSGETDFVKVLDFGVARSVRPEAGRDAITHAGQIVGTPSYVAPEQVRGLPLGPQVDLYALGLVMAEAASGSIVYGKGSPIEIWMKQASSEPVPIPPSLVGSALGPVIVRATRKLPQERYPSAEVMLADLERAMLACTAPTDPLAKPLGGQVSRSTAKLTPPAFRSTTTPLAAPITPRALPARPTPLPLTPIPGAAPSSGTPRSGSGGVILVIALLAVVFVAGGAGALFFVFRPRVEPPEPPLPAPSLGIPTSGRLTAVTAERTEARMRAAGWQVTTSTTQTSLGYKLAMMTLQKGTTGAQVQIYDYESPSIAAETERALEMTSGAAVERDGGRVLYVLVMGEPSQSRALFDDVVR